MLSLVLAATLLGGAGLAPPDWDVGEVEAGAQRVTEVRIQGLGEVEVFVPCTCISEEIVRGTATQDEPAVVRLTLRTGERLGWHRYDVQFVLRGLERTQILRLPVAFDVPSLLSAPEPALSLEVDREDVETRRMLDELGPIFVRCGLSHRARVAEKVGDPRLIEALGRETRGRAAIRTRLMERFAEGVRAPGPLPGEVLLFHDAVACGMDPDSVVETFLRALARRHGLTVRVLSTDEPANFGLLCTLLPKGSTWRPGEPVAYGGGRAFVGERAIREILPRHLIRLAGTTPRVPAGISPAGG